MVRADERREASAQYVTAAKDLRIITMRILKRFPTSYRWIITNSILELANEIYINVIKANSIYVYKDMDRNDYDLRRRYLKIAASSAEAIQREISFCYDLVDDGNNFFKSKDDYNDRFQKWTVAADTALSKINGVLESDKKRWEKYSKSK